VAHQAVHKKHPKKPQQTRHGVMGDLYSVQLIGNAYYVVRTTDGALYGGPYRERDTAQNRADALQRTVTRR
jgi:hypothetical protein